MIGSTRPEENHWQFWYRWLAAFVIFFGLLVTSILLLISFAFWTKWPIDLLFSQGIWRLLISVSVLSASIQTLGRWARS